MTPGRRHAGGKPPFVAGAAEADIRRWLYRVATNNAFSLLRHHRLIHWEPLDDHVELLPDAHTPFEDHLAEKRYLAGGAGPSSATRCRMPAFARGAWLQRA